MKNEIRLALICMAAAAVPAIAQDAYPRCGYTNFDQNLNAITVRNPAPGAVNQQCFITVYPGRVMPSEGSQFPGSYLAEGTYTIELSGGGGGGGGGALNNKGGGGGGAGAAPYRTSQYLAPGVYRVTVGTGGFGGSANGGRTGDGNPTSITNAHTGQLIAGFPGADTWTQTSVPASDGRGGAATAGGSRGGSGGDSGPWREERAQAGGPSRTASGMPGPAGSEAMRSRQANAGGGGGAAVGSGGAGESAGRISVAGIGNLGSGGGGGVGGLNNADAGASGGNGFVRLTMSAPAPVAMAPAPVVQQVIAPAPQYVAAQGAMVTEPAPRAARRAKKDRN